MKINAKQFQHDNLTGTQWLGHVEDTEDPNFDGRCRIRVFGKMDQRIDLEDPNSEFVIPTDKLPWARPSNLNTGGSDSGGGSFDPPKLGSIVEITFDNGNLYSPVYGHAVYVSDELKEEIQASYPNAHVLIYDTAFGQSMDDSGEVTNDREGEGMKVYFTEEKGFMIDYATSEGSTTFNLKPDNSVEVTNPNGDTVVMSNDGNINFTHTGTVTFDAGGDAIINCENAEITANQDATINCINGKISASAEVHVDSPKIKLGTVAEQSIIKGNLFKKFFDEHTHPTPVGPSLPPLPMTPDLLSTISSTD
jgi:hypothetical protein